MNKITPHQIIGHGHCFQKTLLSSYYFVKYCQKRGIDISEKRLEKFEELGIFYPMLRVKHPRCKKKLKRTVTETDSYTEEWGLLQEGEEWSGEIEIYYAKFIFWKKEYVESWIDEGLVYIPSKKTFQPWSTYRIENDFQKQTETYYSIFQLLPLYLLTKTFKQVLETEHLVELSQKEVIKWFKAAKETAKLSIETFQNSRGIRDEIADFVQVISSRYLPIAEKYDGMISLSQFDEPFDWRQYRINWKPEKVLKELDLSIEQVVWYHEIVESEASYIDPIDRWSDLVKFIRNSKKEQLKGDAFLAQNLHLIARIIDLFHKDLTGDFIPTYGKDTKTKERIYGRGIPQNNLAFLEYVSNEFGVNPRPKLFLFVEGDGEVEHFPRLAIELFRINFSEIRIQIQNIHGVGGFEGDKKIDRYGAFEKLIEYYHDKQTIAFFILDKEGRVEKIKQKLITRKSKEHPSRTITREEYIKLWDKNVEFDNFTNKEIAETMTKLSENRYVFTEAEIENCRNRFGKRSEGDTLSRLYKEKTGYGSNKIRLLGLLIDRAVLSPKFEVNGVEIERPLIKTLVDVCRLATRNYQPSRFQSWHETQNSEWLGHSIK